MSILDGKELNLTFQQYQDVTELSLKSKLPAGEAFWKITIINSLACYHETSQLTADNGEFRILSDNALRPIMTGPSLASVGKYASEDAINAFRSVADFFASESITKQMGYEEKTYLYRAKVHDQTLKIIKQLNFEFERLATKDTSSARVKKSLQKYLSELIDLNEDIHPKASEELSIHLNEIEDLSQEEMLNLRNLLTPVLQTLSSFQQDQFKSKPPDFSIESAPMPSKFSCQLFMDLTKIVIKLAETFNGTDIFPASPNDILEHRSLANNLSGIADAGVSFNESLNIAIPKLRDLINQTIDQKDNLAARTMVPLIIASIWEQISSPEIIQYYQQTPFPELPESKSLSSTLANISKELATLETLTKFRSNKNFNSEDKINQSKGSLALDLDTLTDDYREITAMGTYRESLFLKVLINQLKIIVEQGSNHSYLQEVRKFLVNPLIKSCC